MDHGKGSDHEEWPDQGVRSYHGESLDPVEWLDHGECNIIENGQIKENG